jgi:hypothetical protein
MILNAKLTLRSLKTAWVGSGAITCVHAKFGVNWFRHSEVDGRHTGTQHGDGISLLTFF